MKKKNLVDLIQEDFPRTPSPVFPDRMRARAAEPGRGKHAKGVDEEAIRLTDSESEDDASLPRSPSPVGRRTSSPLRIDADTANLTAEFRDMGIRSAQVDNRQYRGSQMHDGAMPPMSAMSYYDDPRQRFGSQKSPTFGMKTFTHICYAC